MKTLELQEMENIQAEGADPQTYLCGASIGMMFFGLTFIAGAALFAVSCLTSDSGN